MQRLVRAAVRPLGYRGYREGGYHAGYRGKACCQTRGCHRKAGFQARGFHSGFHVKAVSKRVIPTAVSKK